MGQLKNNFCLLALQDIFKNTNQIGLGTGSGEVSGGDYTRVSNRWAGWVIQNEAGTGRPTVYNANKVYFPINEQETSYTAADFMAFAARRGSVSYAVYSEPFELGPLTISKDTRVKINAYDANRHRGVFIQLWEA